MRTGRPAHNNMCPPTSHTMCPPSPQVCLLSPPTLQEEPLPSETCPVELASVLLTQVLTLLSQDPPDPTLHSLLLLTDLLTSIMNGTRLLLMTPVFLHCPLSGPSDALLHTIPGGTETLAIWSPSPPGRGSSLTQRSTPMCFQDADSI